MTDRQMIGHYELGELLGEGGGGRVTRARDTILDRDVAIKSLRPELLNDASFVERFKAEATNLARLNHPNITTLYSLITQGQHIYMVMEMVRGRTLETILRERGGPLPPDEAFAIFAQAAEGLSYAHSMGVIHRDIKPGNLIITGNGLLKIMDFGIARVQGSRRLTRDGSIVGTLEYMSPEQLRGKEVDATTDLYSLAIVLYEMLTGKVPFSGTSDYDVMMSQINDAPERVVTRVSGIAPNIDDALMRALSKKPGDRYGSVADFRKSFGAALAHPDTLGTAQKISRLSRGPGFRSLLSRTAAPLGRLHPAVRGAAIASAVMIAGIAVLFGVREAVFRPPAEQQIAKDTPRGDFDPVLRELPGRPVGDRNVTTPASNTGSGVFIGTRQLGPVPNNSGLSGDPGRDPSRDPSRPFQTAVDSSPQQAAADKEAKGAPGRDATATRDDGSAATVAPNNAGASTAPALAAAPASSSVALLPVIQPPAKETAPPPANTVAETRPPAAATIADASEAYYQRKDYQEARRLAEPLAQRGDAEAQYILARLFDEGYGGPKDSFQALQWYEKAANQGHIKARYNLAMMYELGQGTPPNQALAATWYYRAAEMGYARAQAIVGEMFRTGNGLPKNIEQARSWYSKAAASSDVDAAQEAKVGLSKLGR